MSAFPINEKPHNHAEPPSFLGGLGGLFEPVAAPLASTFQRFHNWKEYMGLSQPGTVENLTRDVTSESPRAPQARAAVASGSEFWSMCMPFSGVHLERCTGDLT